MTRLLLGVLALLSATSWCSANEISSVAAPVANQIRARVWKSTNQTVTSGVQAKILFDTSTGANDTYDPTGMWDNTNHVFKIAVSGKYLVGCQLLATSSTALWVYVIKNSTTECSQVSSAGSAASLLDVCTTPIPLVAGDTLECDANDTGVTITSTANYAPVFWVQYIGP